MGLAGSSESRFSTCRGAWWICRPGQVVPPETGGRHVRHAGKRLRRESPLVATYREGFVEDGSVSLSSARLVDVPGDLGRRSRNSRNCRSEMEPIPEQRGQREIETRHSVFNSTSRARPAVVRPSCSGAISSAGTRNSAANRLASRPASSVRTGEAQSANSCATLNRTRSAVRSIARIGGCAASADQLLTPSCALLPKLRYSTRMPRRSRCRRGSRRDRAVPESRTQRAAASARRGSNPSPGAGLAVTTPLA